MQRAYIRVHDAIIAGRDGETAPFSPHSDRLKAEKKKKEELKPSIEANEAQRRELGQLKDRMNAE
jgi:hypothetical protein